MKNVPEKAKGKNFEQALARLEELVEGLERGNLSLEESLAHFEEGSELIKECSGMLEAAEAKLQKLVSTGEGFKLEPLLFSENEDSDK